MQEAGISKHTSVIDTTRRLTVAGINVVQKLISPVGNSKAFHSNNKTPLSQRSFPSLTQKNSL